MKALKIIGILAGVVLVLMLGFLSFIGTYGPDTSIYLGRQVPKRFLKTIRELNLLEEGETVKYFYSDGLMNIKEGMYFVTDRNLTLYCDAWEEPKDSFPLESLTVVRARYDDSFLDDSEVHVETAEFETAFPLSSEKGRDRLFVQYLKEKAGLLKDDTDHDKAEEEVEVLAE